MVSIFPLRDQCCHCYCFPSSRRKLKAITGLQKKSPKKEKRKIWNQKGVFCFVSLPHLSIGLNFFLEKNTFSYWKRGSIQLLPCSLLCWCSSFLSLFSSCATCVCAQFPPQRLQIRSMPPRGSQLQRTPLTYFTLHNIFIQYTLHIYKPVWFVCLFCLFVLFCFPSFLIQGLCQGAEEDINS